MSDTAEETIPAPRIKESLARLKGNITQVIRGKDSVVDQVLICLVAGGHVLIEDLPGLGKTTLAYCLSQSLDCSFSRVQFTSDLLPSDVLGVSIYDESIKEFVFKKGPIFSNIVLADEINRTTPKTQSSLLEAMDRGRVSIEGRTFELGAPFVVFATQNPVDYEGTFPLPESQMDRFLMRLQMGYPAYDHEYDILSNPQRAHGYDAIQLAPVLDRDEIVEIQRWAAEVFVEDSLLHFILKLASETREQAEFENGVSTRGTLALKRAAQAAALYEGRAFVIPEDITWVIRSVFTHRLGLRQQVSDPLEERQAVEAMIGDILERVPLPV